jgi:hypothetical protein
MALNDHVENAAKDLSTKLRAYLEQKLGVIPDDLLIEFGGGPADPKNIDASRPISTDWPDSFDRGSWYKTWAKGGAASRPSELLARRAADRKTP